LMVRALFKADDAVDAVRAANALGNAAQAANHAENAVDLLSHADEAVAGTAEGLRRFSTAGEEIIPGILDEFGDTARHLNVDLPAEFAGRRVTTLANDGPDFRAAGEIGERVLSASPGKWNLQVNHRWIAEAAENGDVFYLGSQVTEQTLRSANPKFAVTVFARELDMLLQRGYKRVGYYLAK